MEADDVSVAVVGEQDAGLLEALADRAHPVRKPVAGHAQDGAGAAVVEARAQGLEVAVGVVQIDLAAGKHEGAAEGLGFAAALEQQHFGLAMRPVAKQHQGGGVVQFGRSRSSLVAGHQLKLSPAPVSPNSLASSRSLNFWILPLGVRGSSSRISSRSGQYWRAMRCWSR